MADWKVYSSLDEVLREIDFDGRSLGETKFTKDPEQWPGEEFDQFILWLHQALATEALTKEGDGWRRRVLYLCGELGKNAYRHDVDASVFAYVGKQGVVIGSKQARGFLDKDQIGLLKSRKPIETDRRCGGKGTDDLVNCCDGICIDESRMALYFLMHYNKTRAKGTP